MGADTSGPTATPSPLRSVGAVLAVLVLSCTLAPQRVLIALCAPSAGVILRSGVTPDGS